MNSTLEITKSWAEGRTLELKFQAQTGSTNDDAKREAFQEDQDFVLYLTGHQTAGRGRGQNQWLDTGAGEGLLSTWSFAVNSPPQAITAPRIGLALYLAVYKAWPSLSWGLKAPNDLYLDGLKVGGLLVESVTSGSNHRLLVGLGLNVANHPRSFSTATHLTGALSRPPDEAEWFRFLDELKTQLTTAAQEALNPKLSASATLELKQALNANSARPFVVESVSADGDLQHSNGLVRWTDL